MHIIRDLLQIVRHLPIVLFGGVHKVVLFLGRLKTFSGLNVSSYEINVGAEFCNWWSMKVWDIGFSFLSDFLA